MIKIGDTEYTSFDDLFYDDNFMPPDRRAKIEQQTDLFGVFMDIRDKINLPPKAIKELDKVKDESVETLIGALFALACKYGIDYNFSVAPKNPRARKTTRRAGIVRSKAVKLPKEM